MALAPQGVGMLVAVLVVGKLVDTGGNARRLVMAGLVLVTIGTMPVAVSGTSGTTPLLGVTLFVRGVGLAFAIAPTMTGLYHTLAPTAVAAATTANAITQQVGGAVGTAVSAVVVQHFIAARGTVDGFHLAFWAASASVLLAFIPALFMPSGTKKA